jgi:hypothetical protein
MVSTIKTYKMNFIRGTDPLDAMGVGKKKIKIKDWIKNHNIPNQEDIDSKSVSKDGDEIVIELTLPPSSEWDGEIVITFHFPKLTK